MRVVRCSTVVRCSAVALFFLSLLSAQDRTIQPITVARKMALVIGNSDYARAPLVNPIRDAAAIAAELRSLGFTVTTENNLKLREFSRALDDFSSHLHAGDLALFYYSGHGIQVDRENYLVPVDYAAADEADVPYAAYSASHVRDKLEKSGARLRILILDACRDNPFHSSRGGPAGLAPMGAGAEGTLIAFATGDNHTASDNPGAANGLFTQYLLEELRKPGLELHDILRNVKSRVYYASDKKQNPFTYDDVAGDFYFRGAAPDPAGIFATGVGSIRFGMQPGEVARLLGKEAAAFSNLAVASEYSPTDVRYFWFYLKDVTLPSASGSPLRSFAAFEPCWKDSGYIVFLFDKTGLFKICLRFLNDCTSRVDLLANWASSFAVPPADSGGHLVLRKISGSTTIEGHKMDQAAFLEIFRNGSPPVAESWWRIWN